MGSPYGSLTGQETVDVTQGNQNIEVPLSAMSPIFVPNLNPPASEDFSVRGTLSGQTKNNLPDSQGLHFFWTGSGTRQNSAYLKDATYPAFQIEAEIGMLIPTTNNWFWVGLCIADTTNEEAVWVGRWLSNSGINGVQVTNRKTTNFSAADDTTGIGNAYAEQFSSLDAFNRYRMQCDGTDIRSYVSFDHGLSWLQVGEYPIAGNFTNGPTKYGLFRGHVGTDPVIMRGFCTHLEETPI